MGGDCSVLIGCGGHRGRYKSAGGMYSTLSAWGTRGQWERRQLISRPPAVSGQIYAVTGPRYSNAVSTNKRGDSRIYIIALQEEKQQHC